MSDLIGMAIRELEASLAPDVGMRTSHVKAALMALRSQQAGVIFQISKEYTVIIQENEGMKHLVTHDLETHKWIVKTVYSEGATHD